MFRHSRRRLENVPFVANTPQAIDLPLSYLLKRINLQLTGEIVVATVDADSISQYHPCELVSRIEVIADGRETLKNYSGWQNMFLSKNRMSVRPYHVDSGLGQATHTFRQDFYIDFKLPNSVRPVDTLLDSRRFSKLQLRITWGNVANIITAGGGGTAVLQNVVMYVQAEETTKPVQPRYILFKEFALEKNVDAVSTQFPIELPYGNIYNDMMIHTWSDGVKSDAIINSINLVENGSIYHLQDLLWYPEKSRRITDTMDYNNATVTTLEAPTYHAHGWYNDFKEDGRITSALNLGDTQDVKLILDVANPGTTDTIYIVIGELIVPPVKA